MEDNCTSSVAVAASVSRLEQRLEIERHQNQQRLQRLEGQISETRRHTDSLADIVQGLVRDVQELSCVKAVSIRVDTIASEIARFSASARDRDDELVELGDRLRDLEAWRLSAVSDAGAVREQLGQVLDSASRLLSSEHLNMEDASGSIQMDHVGKHAGGDQHQVKETGFQQEAWVPLAEFQQLQSLVNMIGKQIAELTAEVQQTDATFSSQAQKMLGHVQTFNLDSRGHVRVQTPALTSNLMQDVEDLTQLIKKMWDELDSAGKRLDTLEHGLAIDSQLALDRVLRPPSVPQGRKSGRRHNVRTVDSCRSMQERSGDQPHQDVQIRQLQVQLEGICSRMDEVQCSLWASEGFGNRLGDVSSGQAELMQRVDSLEKHMGSRQDHCLQEKLQGLQVQVDAMAADVYARLRETQKQMYPPAVGESAFRGRSEAPHMKISSGVHRRELPAALQEPMSFIQQQRMLHSPRCHRGNCQPEASVGRPIDLGGFSDVGAEEVCGFESEARKCSPRKDLA